MKAIALVSFFLMSSAALAAPSYTIQPGQSITVDKGATVTCDGSASSVAQPAQPSMIECSCEIHRAPNVTCYGACDETVTGATVSDAANMCYHMSYDDYYRVYDCHGI